MRRRRLDICDHVGDGASHGGARQQAAPLLVHHGRHHLFLLVAAHHRAQQENNQEWHRVVGYTAGLFFPGVLRSRSICLAHDALFQPISHPVRLEEQAALFLISTVKGHQCGLKLTNPAPKNMTEIDTCSRS